MKDPFGLLQVKDTVKLEKDKEKIHKKRYLIAISVLGVVILTLIGAVIWQSRFSASADVASSTYMGSVKVTGVPATVKSGDDLSITLSVSDIGSGSLKSSYVIVESTGLTLTDTLALSKNLGTQDPGYLRKATPEELAKFEKVGDDSVYWYVGDLGEKQTRSQQIKAKVSAVGASSASIEAKYFVPNTKKVSCGALNLSTCSTVVGQTQVASGIFDLTLQNVDKIKLRAGYNLLTLPYVFATSSMQTFLSSLKSKWAYYYQPTSGGYVDLFKDQNAALIKPGVGFWLYDATGGDYDLPQSKVETNINEPFTTNLDIGWNQIGNPFTKRLVVSGDKILVKELADDGSTTGNIYSLKNAIDNGTLTMPSVLTYKTAATAGTDIASLMEFKQISLGTIVNPYTALVLKSTKKVSLTFPGTEVIAPGDLLSLDEKARIDLWITTNGLNQYGDPAQTVYSGGTPLINATTGQTTDRMDYIIANHPDRPWNK